MKELNHITDEAKIREDAEKIVGLMIDKINELIFDASEEYKAKECNNSNFNANYYYRCLGRVEGACQMLEIVTGKYGSVCYDESGVYFVDGEEG